MKRAHQTAVGISYPVLTITLHKKEWKSQVNLNMIPVTGGLKIRAFTVNTSEGLPVYLTKTRS